MSYNVLNVTRGILIGKGMFMALKALNIASKAHEGQTRKGTGEDYINHPLAVATILMSSGIYDESIISACFLHDVLEDTNFPVADLISQGIDSETIGIITLLTKPAHYKDKDVMEASYYEAISKNPKAVLVKCADRCNNLSTMGECWDADKIVSYIDEANKFLIPMIKDVRWSNPEYGAACYNMKMLMDAITNISLALRKGAAEIKK